jgi:tetratricopeptide (TPR) repeat protein
MHELRNPAGVIFLCMACAAIVPAETRPCGNSPAPGSALQIAFVKCSVVNHDWDTAEEEIRSFRSRHPNSIDGALIEADLLTKTYRLDDAMRVLDSILLIYPRSVPALTLYGEISERLDRPDEAEKWLEKATKYASRDPEVWVRLGDLYLAKRPLDAIPCFQKAVQLSPKDAVAMSGLASAYHEAEESSQAESFFTRAIALNRESSAPSAIPHYLYARYLADEEKFRLSALQYTLALKEDPDYSDAYFGRAEALVELGDWATAVPDLERSVRVPKHELPSLVLMVRVYREMNLPNKAKECSDRLARASRERDSQRVAGNEIAGQMQAASGLMEQQKFDQAAEAYDRLVAGHPEVSHAWMQLGRCDLQVGRLANAEKAFRNVISLDASSSIAHALLGRVLLQQNRASLARTQFLIARRLDPLNLDAALGLAATDIIETRYPDAIRLLQDTQRTAPNDREVSLMLAESLFKEDRRDAAVREVKELLKTDPNDQVAQRMLEAMTKRTATAK